MYMYIYINYTLSPAIRKALPQANGDPSPADTDEPDEDSKPAEPAVQDRWSSLYNIYFCLWYLLTEIVPVTFGLREDGHVIDPSTLETQLPDYDYAANPDVNPGLADSSLEYHAVLMAI